MTKTALVLCERSLIWSKALAAAGYTVTCIDLMPPLVKVSDGITFFCGDASLINPDGFDVCCAFPPCTDLSAAGAVYWPAKAMSGRTLKAASLLLAVASIAMQCKHSLIENPRGLAFRLLGRPSLIVHPYMYALDQTENKQKRTALWLNNWPAPMQTWSDDIGARKFMDWASGRCQTTRARSWPGMAKAFVEALP